MPGGALAEEKLILVLNDLMVLDPTWNLAGEENQKYVLKTRDIPTLINPSLPPPSNAGFNPPSPPLALFGSVGTQHRNHFALAKKPYL